MTAIGLNPINNIVDMTNFIMAELAQPMHAFDADLLHGDTIFIRPARAGERFIALNGEEYTLEPRQPGDCRRRRRHCAGRRDRRRGQRHQRKDHARGSRKRQLPGVLRPQDFRRPSSCAPTPPCASKKRRTRPIRFAAWRAPSNCCRRFRRASRMVGGVADQAKDHPAAGADLAAARLAGTQARPRHRAAEVRRILESLEFGVASRSRACFRSPCPPGAPPKTFRSRTTWWKR